jgi:phage terminase large subunit-like protein
VSQYVQEPLHLPDRLQCDVCGVVRPASAGSPSYCGTIVVGVDVESLQQVTTGRSQPLTTQTVQRRASLRTTSHMLFEITGVLGP